MKMLRVIGLMSGTSLDGVDAALIETDGIRVSGMGHSITLDYDPDLRADLRGLLDRAATLDETDDDVRQLAARVTARHVEAVAAIGERADLIGFHGQTILHRPLERRTWQIGDAASLARETGIAVAYDFRTADVAAGGEGAPFAPAYHAALAANLPRPLAVLNLGGVGNATWIGADDTLLACDTGPANGPLDDWVSQHTRQPCDRDGMLSASGTVDEKVLAHLLSDPYFTRPAPKSLDRLDFARVIAGSGLSKLSAPDGAATLVAFIARSVALAKWPEQPRRWLVTGGGRHNPSIMRALRAELKMPVDPVESVGWDGDALEAQCFAFLAARVLGGLPMSYPGTTGVAAPMAGGRVAQP